MKVLYVLDNFPKLSETFILNEITDLLSRDVEIEILALNNPDETVVNEDVSKFDLPHLTRYFQLPPISKLNLAGCLTPGFCVLLWRSYNSYRSSFDFKHLIRLCYYSHYYRNIDIVHAHFAYRAAIVGMQIGNLLRKPFTFTAHAYEIFNKNHYSKARLRTLSNAANKIFTPSAFNKNYIIGETGVSEEKIEIIRATIPLEKFDTVKTSSPVLDTIKIISIGRLVEKKGFEYLIKAIKIVIEKHKEVELNIIGEGKLQNELINVTLKLGLDNKIKFMGARSNEECIEELGKSDIAVLPCVIAQNGDMDVCPLTLQEAMAMGIPVISTEIGSIKELIENRKEGILVSERDEIGLADAILELIKNPELRKYMGSKGMEKIIKEFNINTQMSKQTQIWQKMMNNPSETTN
ncbi:MAG: glycosyltransferase [Candidatus Dadabacteria bacterium]|nr:glycosyltransferase [Candidatus Dadabacteria bacterium]